GSLPASSSDAWSRVVHRAVQVCLPRLVALAAPLADLGASPDPSLDAFHDEAGSPLDAGAARGSVDCVAALLAAAKPGDVDAPSPGLGSRRPLHAAASRPAGDDRDAVIAALLAAGAC